MENLLLWLLNMPARQRQLVIASAKRMSRMAGVPLTDTLDFIYQHRDELRTRSIR